MRGVLTCYAGGQQEGASGSGAGAAFRRRVDEAARAALRAKNPEGQTVAALAATLRAPAEEVRAVSTLPAMPPAMLGLQSLLHQVALA